MMRDIFKKLLIQRGISPSYAKFLNFKEGRDLIFKGKNAPTLRSLEKRTKEWTVSGKKIIYVNMPFKKLLNRLGYFYKSSETALKQKEITGTVAYKKGIIRGKVKLVLNYDEIKSFPCGAVLVAIMTAPAYVQAMERAKAIITDEGGITCHAAIVSRELGIPCIIGTKIATKVLKDGDLVEVDAERGTVKII
jgi:pyruvate,water dikinase